METRLASPGDAFLLAALHAESFGAARWNLQQITKGLELAITRCWIALHDDKPQGFILCQFATDEAEILTFCVTSAARRQGIAQNLLNKAISEARHEHMGKIFLEVAIDNIAALSLYEKAGFHKTGIRKNYYKRENESTDAVMLTLEI